MWTGWRLGIAWLICLILITFLGVLRAGTDSEYAFASLALIPVFLISWLGGKWAGSILAIIAALMWLLADIASQRQFDANWIPWVNALTRLLTYTLLVILVDKIRVQYQIAHEHATHDVLTGLQNRRAFIAAGQAEVERSKRYGHSLALIFIDLDDFKKLNDTKGHSMGDRALAATAESLIEVLRSSDHVARLGGDEFAILLPEIGYASATDVGQKIFQALGNALQGFAPAKASMGVAWFAKVDRDFFEMLREADSIMYEVKNAGKSNIRVRHITPKSNSDFVT